MGHPIRLAENKALRQRMLHFLKNGLSVPRNSNIVFVCGGNNSDQLRPRFLEYCASIEHEFELFKPESAIDNILSDGGVEPFNIADFEMIVGNISLAIVLFPEAPGSFAETGYFSAVQSLAQKTVLVLDSNRQGGDSFISMGPAKLIEKHSKFFPVIQDNYDNPKFSNIIERIRNRHKSGKLKYLEIDTFSGLLDRDLLYMIYSIVEILRIAGIDDIVFILKGVFRGHTVKKRVWLITSVLVGSGFFNTIDDLGRLSVASSKDLKIRTKEGYLQERNALLIEISTLLPDPSQDTAKIAEAG